MHKILIYTTGNIGDILILLPFFQALREKYSNSHITLLNDPGYGFTSSCKDLLTNTSYVDCFFVLSASKLSFLSRLYAKVKLWFDLHKENFDFIYYAIRDGENFNKRKKVDYLYYKLLFPKKLYGFNSKIDFSNKLLHFPNITQMLRKRLEADGEILNWEYPGDIRLSDNEKKLAGQIWTTLNILSDAIPVLVGIGGKKRVCHWPFENYYWVLNRLVLQKKVYPIFAGGENDNKQIENLLTALGTGANLTKFSLTLRESIAVFQHCSFYLGNDSGTIHMAACAGIPCLGIYSAHSCYGMWHPLGEGHVVLRTEPECTGCRRQECDTYPARCIAAISPELVLSECMKMLERVNSGSSRF